MPATKNRIPITVEFPTAVLVRVESAAAAGHKSVQAEINLLVQEGLDARLSTPDLFDELSAQYRARLARQGKLNRSADEVFAELRELRERVGNELHPR